MTSRSRRLAAAWFADIVGYTDLSSRDEKAALRVVDELQRLASEEVESRRGRIVKFIGDAALATFDSANTALESATKLGCWQRPGHAPETLGTRLRASWGVS